ncbi:MAG: hypothetical protein ACI8PZ_005262 [Myxococcota bacterium]|jgi:hypothetical protein
MHSPNAPAVVAAARSLAALHTDVPAARFLDRLKAEAPVHPLLLALRLSGVAAGVFTVFALLTLAAPFTHAELALWLGRLDASAGLPLPAVWAVLAACSAVFAVGCRELSIARGKLSPLLADERGQHRKLAAKWMQADAAERVKLRLVA